MLWFKNTGRCLCYIFIKAVVKKYFSSSSFFSSNHNLTIKINECYFLPHLPQSGSCLYFSINIKITDFFIIFQDCHGSRNGNGEPVQDDTQNYIVEEGYQNLTHTKIKFRRPLETCDPHDVKITVNIQ